MKQECSQAPRSDLNLYSINPDTGRLTATIAQRLHLSTLNMLNKLPDTAMKKYMKIAFVISSLHYGGAERVVSILANTWASKGHLVRIVTLLDTGESPAYQLHPAVDLLELKIAVYAANNDGRGVISKIYDNLRSLSLLRIALADGKPDVVLSFLDTTNVSTLLSTRGLALAVIVSERTDPGIRSIGRAWSLLRQLSYPWADAVICQGERPLRYFGPHIHKRAHVIPNPVTLPPEATQLHANLTRNGEVRIISALGSLRAVKGFDLLLGAFAQVAVHHPNWRLMIWGEGPARSELEAQAKQLGIAERITMPGTTREPFAKLAETDLFVLSSRVEGFPNALCEAMAVGLPVIATDVGAVPDIIRAGTDGVIVPPGDVSAMAMALDRMMGDLDERLRLASRAPEVLERFSLEKVVGRWENLIREVTGKTIL